MWWWYPAGIEWWAGVVLVVVDLAVFLAALVTIPRNRRPTTALAWLLTIFLIPYVGFLLFLAFGTNRLSARRRRMQAEVDAIIRDATRGIPLDAELPELAADERLGPIVRLARQLTSVPLVDGNRLALHGSYDRTIAAIAAAIDTADERVHMLYYTLALDDTTAPVFDALARAVERGVSVRVLFDHLGSLKTPGYRRMRRRLREIGCEARPVLSIWPWEGALQRIDLRNHRKLVVIDDRIGFMGSQNLIDRAYHHRRPAGRERLWKDLMVEVEGPMVAAMNAVFISDWFAETLELLASPAELAPLASARVDDDDAGTHACQLVPSGPGYEHENNLRLFDQILYSARERVTIVSPYFVPDDSLLYAITTAAQRGVEVTLYVGEVGDQFFAHHAQRSYYDALLSAGVRIRLYRRPYILHSKHVSVDDAVTLIGSSNMDMRSFTLNAELTLMVLGPEFATRMREVENGYRQRSVELDLAAWRARPIATRAFDNVARLTSVLQ